MNINIGIGKYDVTGPCADVGFYGYFDTRQRGRGIRARLYSRAFVIEDLNTSNSVALVNVDIGHCSQAIYRDVLAKLEKAGMADIYNEKNLLVAGSHTHSAPGGYSESVLFNATMLGFNEQNFTCIVEGIFQSVMMAHNNKVRGKITISTGIVEDCGGNRSIDAYNYNPAEEREKYLYAMDKEMTLLKFLDLGGNLLGSINWFALHPTNMGQKNRLISSDNKGYAAWRLELDTGAVCAFGNSSCGDVSPNVKYGPPDDENDYQRMVEFGTRQYEAAADLLRQDGEELTGSIDCRQTYVDMSRQEFTEGPETYATWPAAFGLSTAGGSTQDSVGVPIWPEGYNREKLEGDGNLWRRTLGFLSEEINEKLIIPKALREEYQDGQGNKPFLFAAGLVNLKGTPLISQVAPLQLLKIGNLVIIAHPGEITTMAARRVREAVLGILYESGVTYTVVVAYAGAYLSYTTTHEEYDAQYYEGASNLFGPWTLKAYKRVYEQLAMSIKDRTPAAPGPLPPNMIQNRSISLPPLHFVDLLPRDKYFGQVVEQPEAYYSPGRTVSVRFYGAYPNNRLRTNETYTAVEQMVQGKWRQVYVDKDFCTGFHWDTEELSKEDIPDDISDSIPGSLDIEAIRDNLYNYVDANDIIGKIPGLGTRYKEIVKLWEELLDILDSGNVEKFVKRFVSDYSIVTVTWEIPKEQAPGVYRLVYYGDNKTLAGDIVPFRGETRDFLVKK